ncbi:hypothetical protein [Streptomyces beijiangensis]|uniref:Secreted protein n=1 Tax=Streptomyces beijiangensis TaxID=163361 RepID=A0A939FDZ1_9ACTN|nr:hypothetical protein [Streptomyces beijiangensis]MBO0516868.1 hypothetical protein [Streptomyces beijiangensis]
MHVRTSPRTRSAVVASGFAALALFAAACSGSGSDDGASKGSSSTGSGGNADDAAVKQRKCLREHGLKVPEPKPGEKGVGLTIGGDMDKAQLEKALKACAGKGGLGTGGKITQADKDKMLKYAQCMRKNGYNMPDPKFDGSMMSAQKMPQGAEKKKFDKASKICESIVR